MNHTQRASLSSLVTKRSSPFPLRLDAAIAGCLFLLAFCAPHSIAATQTAWLLAIVAWVLRFAFRPRPRLWRTPVDYALLGFFILSFISALFSYEPDISIGKLRAASLFTIVYVVAENVGARRTLRALVIVLVASCTLNVLYTFGAFAVGRGIKLQGLTADSPLRALDIREGMTLLDAEDVPLRRPEELVAALERPATPDDLYVHVRVYHVEALPVVPLPRGSLLPGDTPEARLGITSWSHGRDQRASGFYGHYTTYAEVLQLITSLALGLLLARGARKGGGSWLTNWRSDPKRLLLALAVAAFTGALLLTVTRASWLGFLLSAFVIVTMGARLRMLLVTLVVALPLVAGGLFILQQKRRVGFIDLQEGSTSWRLMVYREASEILFANPRHMLVGVGMDTIKRRWREWGMFDRGRQPFGHLHSTPLQLAFERGIPVLLVWLALLWIYARTLWRLAQHARREPRDWVERGLAMGALGGLVGFIASGMVHYNLGDSEVVMVFYIIMGLSLACDRLLRQYPTTEDASPAALARSDG